MTWWHYLLLANVYLTLFFVFYALFLRKETFFNLNRVYLVSSALLSFLIPGIQADWVKSLLITHKVQETIYHVNTNAIYQFTVTATPVHQLTLGQILGGIYLLGILVLSFRFIYQLAVINWVINQPKSDTSYSFFNQIKIEDRDTDNIAITAHEEAHARHWHSIDVLLLEAIMIINWFNPVVYLYRNAVKYIHEFIADRDAIKAGTNKAEYAMLLLSQTFVTPPYHLVNPFFNSSLLKQRIQMLHKNRSHRAMLIKYGLSAPLFGLMLVLSSATVKNSKTMQALNNTAQEVFTTPAVATFNGNDLSKQDEADLNDAIRRQAQAARALEAQNAALAELSPAGKKYTSVESPAQFPGGIEAFSRFLSANIRYPAEARQKNIQGKVVCTFIVEKDGSITGLKVISGIGGGADQEALRILGAMPKWTPGMQNGSAVRQRYTVPISFNLTDNLPGGNENEVFSAVEHSADFPGGLEAFSNYIAKTVRYPSEARIKHIQGRVFVTFVIEKDGSLSDIKILRDIGGGLGEEAVRVISQSPKWIPALQNGRNVRQQYTAPINFTLTDDVVADPPRNKDTTKTVSARKAFTTYNYTPTPARVADTSAMEAHFTSKVKAPVVALADTRISPVKSNSLNPIEQLKDKAVKSVYSEKATNGVVLMVTKHKSFFDQGILGF